MVAPFRAAVAASRIGFTCSGAAVRRPTLPREQQMAAVLVQAEVSRLAVGAGKVVDFPAAIAELTAISADPHVLGHALGVYLALAEEYAVAFPGVVYYEPAVILLHLAGADRAAAEQMLAWQRSRRARERQPAVQFRTPGV